MRSINMIAAVAALSLSSTSAFAQTQVAAGAASSSSSSSAAAASGTGGNATITNQRQLIPGTAIGIAPPPTATCQRTKGFGISVPFFGVSFGGSKGDKECQFVQMLDRTVLTGPFGQAMACRMGYNHWLDWAKTIDELGIDCRDLLPQAPVPVAMTLPPPPPVVVAPPPQIIRETRVVERVVVRYVPRHVVRRHVVRRAKPACGCKVGS